MNINQQKQIVPDNYCSLNLEHMYIYLYSYKPHLLQFIETYNTAI